MNAKQIITGIALITYATFATVAEHSQLKAFPEAEEGMERHVIVLPEKDRSEEVNFQVELIAGKTIETDGTNRTKMATNIESKPLKGWGYTFYEMSGSDMVMSTMMAVPGDQPKVTQFVGGEPLKIRYNSRLPIVIYAPEGFEIRYRIWEAPEQFNTAEQG